jgi:hypothetical protein
MSKAQEYLVKDAMIYSTTINSGENTFFLLFNTEGKTGKALIDYFETPGVCIDINFNEVDEYYILPTIGQHLGKVSDENQNVIKEICEMYLNDRMYLSFSKDKFIISDFNYLNEQSDSKIIGVFLKTSAEFQNFFLKTPDEMTISKFNFEVQGEEGI